MDDNHLEEPGRVVYWLLAVFGVVVLVALAVFYYVMVGN